MVELGRGRVERDRDLLAGHAAGGLDRLDQQRERRPRSCSRSGAKPPSSPTAVDEPLLVQHALQRVVGLGAPAERLGERGRADGDDHELLEVDVVVGVHAAVEDVHHRDGEDVGVRRRRRSGRAASSSSSAAALATASETPRIALAPRRDLFGVPSRSMSARSTPAGRAPRRPTSGVGDLAGHVRDGAAARPCRRSVRRRRGARRPRTARSRRPTARSRCRSRPLSRRARRPRRSGSPGSRGPPGPRAQRSALIGLCLLLRGVTEVSKVRLTVRQLSDQATAARHSRGGARARARSDRRTPAPSAKPATRAVAPPPPLGGDDTVAA